MKEKTGRYILHDVFKEAKRPKNDAKAQKTATVPYLEPKQFKKSNIDKGRFPDKH